MTPMSLVHLVIWVMPIFPRPSYQLRLLILKNSIDHPAVLGPYFRWVFFFGGGDFSAWVGGGSWIEALSAPTSPSLCHTRTASGSQCPD